MTNIFIRNVRNLDDLLAAISAMTEAFRDAARFRQPENVFSRSDEDEAVDECGCTECRPALMEACETTLGVSPQRYLPCGQRGTHLRLVDCWACWCDVRRGAVLEVDVLSPDAWDVAAVALFEGAYDESPTRPAAGLDH